MKKLALGLWLIAEFASAQFRPMRFRRDGAAGITVVTSVDINDSGGTDITGSPCLGGNCAFTLPAAAGGGAPTTSTYITQVADAGLSAEQALGALGTGLVLNTTTTGVLSIFAGTSCTNQFPRSLNASGAATCASVSMTADVTGVLALANGGTGASTAADDALLVGSGTGWVAQSLPSCSAAESALNYNNTTNTLGCATLIDLQATTPGTPQTTANLNIDGTAVVNQLELGSGDAVKWTGLGTISATVDGRFLCGKATPDNTCQLLSGTTSAGSGVVLGASGVVSAIGGGQANGIYTAGGWRFIPQAKTASTYTAAANDGVLRGDGTSNAVAFTLPTAAANGQYYTIFKSDSTANLISVVRASSNTIVPGNTTVNLPSQYSVLGIEDAGPSTTWTPTHGNMMPIWTTYTADNAQKNCYAISELLTLSTGGTTTDTAADLLPANSIIEAVVWRVTSSLDGGKTIQIGDPTTAGRFSAAAQTGTAGSTGVGLVHRAGNITTVAAGSTQAAAAKVRVTASGTPASGIVRLTSFVCVFVPPGS